MPTLGRGLWDQQLLLHPSLHTPSLLPAPLQPSLSPPCPPSASCLGTHRNFSGLTRYFSSERAEIPDTAMQQQELRLGVEIWGLAMPPLMCCSPVSPARVPNMPQILPNPPPSCWQLPLAMTSVLAHPEQGGLRCPVVPAWLLGDPCSVTSVLGTGCTRGGDPNSHPSHGMKRWKWGSGACLELQGGQSVPGIPTLSLPTAAFGQGRDSAANQDVLLGTLLSFRDIAQLQGHSSVLGTFLRFRDISQLQGQFSASPRPWKLLDP